MVEPEHASGNEDAAFAEVSPPRTRADMRTLAHQSVVCEVPTRFVISAYSNRVMVVVTQADNMGTLVSTAAQAPARPAAADV